MGGTCFFLEPVEPALRSLKRDVEWSLCITSGFSIKVSDELDRSSLRTSSSSGCLPLFRLNGDTLLPCVSAFLREACNTFWMVSMG